MFALDMFLHSHRNFLVSAVELSFFKNENAVTGWHCTAPVTYTPENVTVSQY